jgi:phosphocarrier protein
VNESGPNAANRPIVRRATIVNKLGLHARAAAKFVKLADRFDAQIAVAHKDMNVSGRSIMGLMMLAAAEGGEIEIRADGPEAAAASDALLGLIAAGFDEDD